MINGKYIINKIVKGNGRIYYKRYPSEYKSNGFCNGFFKYISIQIENRWFTINFMRWYIEDNKVNCRFGEIQFDATDNGHVNIKNNYKTKIKYSNDYIDQPEKKIRLNEDQVCVYNPELPNIWKIQKENAYDEVVRKFDKFIENVIKEVENNKK